MILEYKLNQENYSDMQMGHQFGTLHDLSRKILVYSISQLAGKLQLGGIHVSKEVYFPTGKLPAGI